MECSPSVSESRERYLTIEKQIIRDLAEEIELAVTSLSKQPAALNLIPVKMAIASLHGTARTLEKIAR